MFYLSTLDVGHRFRVARPDQKSLNNLEMPRECIFRVTKIFSQSPFYVISVKDDGPDQPIYSLGHKTPVILPKEHNPSEESIAAFIGVKRRKKTVGYTVLWDGATPLNGLTTRGAAAVLKMLFTLGKVTYSPVEVRKATREHIRKFTKERISEFTVYYAMNVLVYDGLVAVITDDAPDKSEGHDTAYKEVQV